MDAEQQGQQPQPRRSRPSRLTNEAMPQPRRSSKSVAESSDDRRSSTGPRGPNLKTAAMVRVVRAEVLQTSMAFRHGCIRAAWG